MKSFYAPSAKMDAMMRDLLQDEDFYRLSEIQTFPQLIQELKKYPIAAQLDWDDRPLTGEGKLEKFGREQLQKLSHYYNDSYRLFLKRILDEVEIKEIKTVLRFLQNKNSFALSSQEWKGLKKYHVDQDTTIAQFLDQLKETRYYNILKPYEDEQEDVILFYMEMNLDKQYYQSLMDVSRDFSRKDQREVRELMGRKIDLLNVIWIYRGLKFYHLMPEELINFVIRRGYYFSYDQLQKLCYCDSFENFVEELSQSPYGFLLEGDRQEVYMDRRKNRYLHYLAKDAFRKHPFSFGKCIAYIFLLKDNIKDMVTLMETTRFQMKGPEKRKYLIRSYKGSDEYGR